MLQQSLHITYVEESARWMGSCKHNYWHWLHCQLPQGQVRLTDLKLTHPEVIPNRDRIAAPMRLASWIRFETLMASDDWEGAISMLVSNLHQPDQELLRLLQLCVAGQEIASMEEAQALLLRNFRVGKDNQSFFLHEWRRCVCRLCTSHLSRVNIELPARLRPNRERKKHKQAPKHTKPNKHPKTTRKGATCRVTRSAMKA